MKIPNIYHVLWSDDKGARVRNKFQIDEISFKTWDEIEHMGSDVYREIDPAVRTKDRTLFVAFYFWGGYNKQTLWQEFDKVYELADEFVKSYSQYDGWEDRSFEEYMHEFITKHTQP